MEEAEGRRRIVNSAAKLTSQSYEHYVRSDFAAYVATAEAISVGFCYTFVGLVRYIAWL